MVTVTAQWLRVDVQCLSECFDIIFAANENIFAASENTPETFYCHIRARRENYSTKTRLPRPFWREALTAWLLNVTGVNLAYLNSHMLPSRRVYDVGSSEADSIPSGLLENSARVKPILFSLEKAPNKCLPWLVTRIRITWVEFQKSLDGIDDTDLRFRTPKLHSIESENRPYTRIAIHWQISVYQSQFSQMSLATHETPTNND